MPPSRPSSDDSFLSIEDGPEVEIKEKGSRFVGQAFRAADEEAALGHLAGLRKRYHAATHHCSAYRVGAPGAVLEKSDDDGEPSGTAGPPILSVLQGEAIHGAIVVVTRWYGGTKLGKGGLIRAYSEAAKTAVAAAPVRTVWREAGVSIACGYDDLGTVEAVLAREGARIRACDRDFAGDPRFDVVILVGDADRIRAALVEATADRAQITVAPLDPDT